MPSCIFPVWFLNVSQAKVGSPDRRQPCGWKVLTERGHSRVTVKYKMRLTRLQRYDLNAELYIDMPPPLESYVSLYVFSL